MNDGPVDFHLVSRYNNHTSKVTYMTQPQAHKLTRSMLAIQATPDTAGIRTAELFNIEHTVIPIVALVEGVLWPANAPGPELALADEFGRFPQGWDGRPVVLDHPRVNEEAVSANSPTMLEGNSIGQLFNTHVEDGKLKSEIWINSDRVTELGEVAEDTVARLKDGEEMVEISTGLFAMSEQVTGKFEGEEFHAIWRNIVPDHLAILPEGVTGACSIEDGCGAPRTNTMVPVMRAAILNDNCSCETIVTYNGTGTGTGDDDEEEQEGIFKRLLSIGGGILGFKDSSEHLSDVDTRAALNTALGEAEPDRFFFILAIFSSNRDSGKVIYELGFTGDLFSRDFKIMSSGTIKLMGDSTKVRPVTTFVPVDVVTDNEANSTTQENAMTPKEKLVKGLVASEATQYTEADSEWLSSLEEGRLSKMLPIVAHEDTEAAAPATTTVMSILAPQVDDLNVIDDEEEEVVPITTEAYIADAPDEVQEVLNSGLQMHRARKEALVKALHANARCKFSEEDLEAKPIEELENLAALAADISYAGAAPNLNSAAADDDEIPAAPQLFDLNKTADAA